MVTRSQILRSEFIHQEMRIKKLFPHGNVNKGKIVTTGKQGPVKFASEDVLV
jgi:hypothetical protein